VRLASTESGLKLGSLNPIARSGIRSPLRPRARARRRSGSSIVRRGLRMTAGGCCIAPFEEWGGVLAGFPRVIVFGGWF
jgi:hypothetical protein